MRRKTSSSATTATLVLDGRDASLGVEGGSIRLGEAFAHPANPGHLVLNGSTVLSGVETNSGSTVSGFRAPSRERLPITAVKS